MKSKAWFVLWDAVNYETHFGIVDNSALDGPNENST